LIGWLGVHRYSAWTTMAVIVVVVSYLANIVSMVTVLLKLLENKMVSMFSKRYFQRYSRLYITMVIVSGDCFLPLLLISSKVQGAPMLSSGLSQSQREQYRLHHLVSVVLLRNIPLFVVECYFLLILGTFSVVIVVASISTVLSLSIATAMMLEFYVINRRRIELPFTIDLRWNTKGDGDRDDDEQRQIEDTMMETVTGGGITTNGFHDGFHDGSGPLSRVGRRRRLAVELEQRFSVKLVLDGEAQLRVDVLSATRQSSGVLIDAVMFGMGPHSERLVQSTVDGLADDEKLQRIVDNAVRSAFDLDEFSKRFEFTVRAWRHCYRPPAAAVTPGFDAVNSVTTTPGVRTPQLQPTESAIISVLERQQSGSRGAAGHETKMSTAL